MPLYEKYWWIAGAVSFVSLVAILWFQWGQQIFRAFRMRRPFHANFTTEKGKEVFFEMRWPRDSETIVNLRIHPLVHFTRYELVFGFEGDENSRPPPIKAVNTFIKIGRRREQSPADTDSHAIDSNNNYHIKETVELTRGNVFTVGFQVQTRQPGRYPVRLEFITDSGQNDPIENLVFIVEDR